MKSSWNVGYGLTASVWPHALTLAGLGLALACVYLPNPPATCGAQVAPTGRPAVDAGALDAKIMSLLKTHGDGIKASVWVGGPTGTAWYTWQPDEIRPTASAVKIAFLVELFARYAGALERTPPELEEVLREGSPALLHYAPAERNEVRAALSGLSVRSLGRVMMGSDPASNVVYNSAANVVTALFGGPEEITKAIRARDRSFASIAVRRYMLAPRHVTGDNEATASALAAVLQRLASRRIPGMVDGSITDVRNALLVTDLHGGRYHFKHGDLNSDPLARIRSGWLEVSGGRTVVCVVMVTQPNPGSHPREEAGERLDKTAQRITGSVLDTVLTGNKR